MSNIGASAPRPKRNIKKPERYSPVLEPWEHLEDDLSVEEDALSIATDESLGGKPIDADGEEEDGYETKKAKKEKYIKDGFVRGDDSDIEYEEGANAKEEEEEDSWDSNEDEEEEEDEDEKMDEDDDDDNDEAEDADDEEDDDEQEWNEVADPQFSPHFLYQDTMILQSFHNNSESSLPGLNHDNIPIAIPIPTDIPTALPAFDSNIGSSSPNPANE